MLKLFNDINGDIYIETKSIEAVYSCENGTKTTVITTSGNKYILDMMIDKVTRKIYDLNSF